MGGKESEKSDGRGVTFQITGDMHNAEYNSVATIGIPNNQDKQKGLFICAFVNKVVLVSTFPSVSLPSFSLYIPQ